MYTLVGWTATRSYPGSLRSTPFMTGGGLAHDRDFLVGHGLLIKPFSFDTLETALEIGRHACCGVRPSDAISDQRSN
jgi:hypothetical protein